MESCFMIARLKSSEIQLSSPLGIDPLDSGQPVGRLNMQKAQQCWALKEVAPRPGLEPGTYGLTVRCSTN